MSYRGHIIPPKKKFADGDEVLVAKTAGWGSRPIDRQQLPATIIRATPQHGDTYLVRFSDGRLDIISVQRIEAA